MKLIEHPQFDALQTRLGSIGCVVEFVPIALEGADGCDPTIQRAAALMTLCALQVRTDRYFEQLLARADYAAYDRADFFRVAIDAEALDDGEAMDSGSFIGRGCDLPGRRLLFRGTTKNHLNDMFWFGDRETWRNRVVLPDTVGTARSLSSAYVDPPYPLGGTPAEQNAAFFDTLDLLLGGMRGRYAIRRWSDAASNYFDAGREWWGTSFWTVHEIGTDAIVGIAASATD